MTKTYILQGDTQQVMNILANLKHFGELHPLIRKVERIESENENNNVFKVKEQPFEWIPIHINYTAKVNITEEHVIYDVEGLPHAPIQLKYTFQKLPNHQVKITFHLSIQGKLPGKRFLHYKMLKAQDHLMEAMQEKLNLDA